VAQRVSTIMRADRIIVLDAGVIAGIGTHEELMKDNAIYREIVFSQLSEEEVA
jgi:ATP-binding cassette subfamily B multidrug efflux pump